MITAAVQTDNAHRYTQQLCKHWGHRCEVIQSDDSSEIILPLGQVVLRPREDRLDIALHPDAGADVERMKKVVADHLDRFAFREAPLAFNWQETA